MVRVSKLALTSMPLGRVIHGATGKHSGKPEHVAYAYKQWILHDAESSGRTAEDHVQLDKLIKDYFSLENLSVQTITQPDAKHSWGWEISKNTMA